MHWWDIQVGMNGMVGDMFSSGKQFWLNFAVSPRFPAEF